MSGPQKPDGISRELLHRQNPVQARPGHLFRATVPDTTSSNPILTPKRIGTDAPASLLATVAAVISTGGMCSLSLPLRRLPSTGFVVERMC